MATAAIILSELRLQLHLLQQQEHQFSNLVDNLAECLRKDDLGMTDDLGYTALHYAAVGGGLKACRALVRKNPDLTQTTSNDGWTPLLAAACCTPKDEETVWYLALHTTDAPRGCPFTGPLADILLYLIERGNPGLATVRDDCGCNLLDALASKPSDFESGSILRELQKSIYPLSVLYFLLSLISLIFFLER